jgi:hypothetical protein
MQQQLAALAGQWAATSSPSSTLGQGVLEAAASMEGVALPVAVAPTLSPVEGGAAAM